MPLPGAPDRPAVGTSRVVYMERNFAAGADSNWHPAGQAVTNNGQAVVRLGSPNLMAMLTHTDTTTTDTASIEIGMILLDEDEFQGIGSSPMEDSQVRRIFNVQRWIQNGSQPPVQVSRMGKLITLKPGISLWIAARIGQLRGGALSNQGISMAFRASERGTTT